MTGPSPSARPRLDPKVARVLLFLAIFLGATGVHYFTRPYVAPVINRDINAVSAARLINLLTPSAHVVASDVSVGREGVWVQIAIGCDGLDALLLLCAAMVAFPMSLRRKLGGVALGVAVIFVLNLLRIAALWYCLRYRPAWFDTMHEVVGMTVLIVAAIAFFGAWTGAFGSRRAVSA